MKEELTPLGHAKDSLIDLAIRFGPKLLTAILILTAGAFVATWVARAASRGLSRIDLEPPVRQLLTRVTRVLVLGLFLLMALQNLGVELLPLIAGLGVAGAGIALATQGVLSNMVAGLTIIFTKPYRVGEYIAVVGVEGQVETIALFNTALRHPDRSRIIVPNRKIVGEILHNYGSIRQSDVRVGVAYESDLGIALVGRGGRLWRRGRRAPCIAGRGIAPARHQHSLSAAGSAPDRRRDLSAGDSPSARRPRVFTPPPRRS
jgi:small conductance mechanosensitive channel